MLWRGDVGRFTGLAKKDVEHDILTPTGAWVSFIMSDVFAESMPDVLPRCEEAVAVEAIVA